MKSAFIVSPCSLPAPKSGEDDTESLIQWIFLVSEDLSVNVPSLTKNFILQILIRNIDRKLTQPEILDLFRKFGSVHSCDLVSDPKTGQSKGFGFADMPNLDEAIKAIAGLNGKKIGSSALRVKRAANSTVLKKRPK